MTVKSILTAAVLATAAIGASPASALLQQVDVLLPVEYYNMNNGAGSVQKGDFQYWDATYSGTGNKTTDNAFLSGGTGALTNGVIANNRWDYHATNTGTGAYVGWNTTIQSPNILFHLGGTTAVKEVSFFVDNSYVGLVGGPGSIVMNGVTYDSDDWTMTLLQHDPYKMPGAYKLTIAGLDLSARDILVLINPGPIGADVAVYNAAHPNFPYLGTTEPWLMVSEVQFNGVSAVPELSTWMMMLIGFGLFGFVAYRRKLKRNPVVA